MAEDRLEKALEAMRNENVSEEQLAGARARVWEKLGNPGVSACAEFQPVLRDYLDGRLPDSRQLLMEDHLSRCPQCRAQLAELRGERKVVAFPQKRISSWPRWSAWAAVAALVFVALYLGRDRVDRMLAPGGPRATVDSVTGVLHRLPAGVLRSGAPIGDGEVIRTGPGTRAVLRLADGSLVDLNERTEMSVRAAWSGQAIQLQHGDIIVQAAKQRHGHLRVQTRDSVASVRGTVFAVSAGLGGTVVSVIEGAVAVTQPGVDVVLSPGEQSVSNPALAYSVQDAIAWSPDADTYLSLLASFAKLEKEIAGLPSPALRTQSRLLEHLPANTVLYGAVPNLTGTISQAVALAEQQSAENPVFSAWWNSETGQELQRLIDRMQSITPLLGDEIVYGFSTIRPGAREGVPMVLAEVLPGKRAGLASALEALSNENGGIPLPCSLTDSLMVVSDSQAHLEWLLGHLGQGAATPFAEAIADRYRRGAGWLLAVDMEPAISPVSGAGEAELIGVNQMKHLFLELRGLQGGEENEVTLTFRGPRMGMASWLASAGSCGAAEYLSSDATFAVYASTREPRQLFEEITAQFGKLDPSAAGDLAAAEEKLGIDFANDLAASFGTESAFALEGFSVTGPVWVLAALVNDPATLDKSIRRLVDVYNSELAPDDQASRITIVQETVEGRVWTTLKPKLTMLSATWTYDRGYLLAASDRGAAMRAIATRNGGSPLVWSAAFQRQLPSSAGLHPAAFAWLNTKGAFQGLEALVPNASLQQLLAERDPILVVFGGTTEQIRAASRTRITGMLIDVMLLESLARTRSGAQQAVVEDGEVQQGTR